MSYILVATGVKREAATLARAGFVAIAGGGDAARLRAKLEAAAAGASGMLSFGMAGALREDLRIGDWVVGTGVRGAVDLPCDVRWSDALAARTGARRGPVHADGRLIAAVAEKLALGADGALAVDMESHVAAEVAAAHGLPFAIARCISDEARHAMPPAILVAMRTDGGVDGGAMLRSLLMQPGQVPDVAVTIAGFLRAMRALKRGAANLEAAMWSG